MAGGGWGCPHETNGTCSKVNNLPCDPGMKGCVLYGRFAFFNEDKNARLRQKQEREQLGKNIVNKAGNEDDAS